MIKHRLSNVLAGIAAGAVFASFFPASALASVQSVSLLEPSGDVVPGEYLVKYKGNSFAPLLTFRSMASVRVLDQNRFGHLLKLSVNPVGELETVAKIASDANVEYVVPNSIVHAFRAPAPTQVELQVLKDQWANKKINAEQAWTRAGNRGSRNVVVAVIDTGVDYNHESLKGNVVDGYNFKDNNTDPMDKTGSVNPGHGTHCSGIIGGNGLVDGGVIGISPEVSIMPLRFLGEDGSGDLNSAIKAVDYAVQKKVQIISASWGATIGRSQAQPLVDAIKRADDAGVIFVAAAANDGSNNDSREVYPANSGFDNTITVAASGSSDEKPSWSNYGKRTVHLASPGLNIMSSLPGNKYGNLSGTSMATPLVAGLVAFLKAQDPSLTGRQVRALLQETGPSVEIETACHCRIDALAAVDKLLTKQLYLAPAAGNIKVGDTLKFDGVNGKAPYTYSVSDSSVATISADGLLTAAKDGSETVTVKDADGKSVTSLAILVESKSSGGGGGGGGGGMPGGGDGKCPFGDQSTCDMLCKIQPTLPFCNK